MFRIASTCKKGFRTLRQSHPGTMIADPAGQCFRLIQLLTVKKRFRHDQLMRAGHIIITLNRERQFHRRRQWRVL